MIEEYIAQGWIDEISIFEGLVLKNRPHYFSDKLFDAIYDDPELAWKIILLIANKQLSEWVMDNFICGPLETFIYKHSRRFQPKIDTFCAESEKFREMYMAAKP